LVEAPAPAVGDTVASCLPATDTIQRLTNAGDRYCLTYPAEYKVEKPNAHETILAIGGLLDAGNPRLHIVVGDAAGASAGSAVDRIVRDFEGFTLERSAATIAGEPAVVLDGVLGQDVNRRVIFVHDGLLYELTFAPADATLGEIIERTEALQEQVLINAPSTSTPELTLGHGHCQTTGHGNKPADQSAALGPIVLGFHGDSATIDNEEVLAPDPIFYGLHGDRAACDGEPGLAGNAVLVVSVNGQRTVPREYQVSLAENRDVGLIRFRILEDVQLSVREAFLRALYAPRCRRNM
jgi:hypothetical protein